MRKKFTMLFAALLACVGVVKAEVNAELQNKKIEIGATVTEVTDGWYILNNVGRNNYVSEETTVMKMRATSSVVNEDAAAAKAGYLFKITTVSEGKYNIQSGNGLYFSLGWNSSAISKEPVEYEISLIGKSTNNFCLYDVTNKYAADGQETNNNFVGWSNSIPTIAGGNDSYRLLPVTLKEASFVELVYNFVYDGEVKYTQKELLSPGATYPDYTIEFPFGVTADTKPEGQVTENVTKDITLTVSLPFSTSTLNDGTLNATWYKVYMNKGTTSWNYNLEANNIDVANKPEDGDYTSAYMFAFVGDVFNGFKIYNKYLGASKVLWQPTGDVNDSGVAITMANASDAIGGNWILEYNQKSEGKDYYVFRRDEVNQAYMNPRGNKLSYWLSSWGKTDGNATISFAEVTNEELVALAKVDFDAIFAKASDINAGKGTGVGEYTVPANFESVYAEAETISKQDTPDGNEMETVTASLKELVEASTLNLPSEDKFYVIKSAKYEGGLVYANEDNRIYWSTEKTATANSEAIWQFEGTENGSLKLRNVHNNQYISELGWIVASFLGDEAECLFTIIPQGSGVVFIKGQKDNFSEMHAQGSGTGGELVRYNTNTAGSASSWIIEEATAPTYTLTVGEAGWASLVLGFNATIPNDVKAYIVSSTTNGYANLSEVTGVLPANTPVLIEAPEGKCIFAYSAETATVGDNLLQGKPYNTYVAENAYVLAKKNDVVGLYKAKKNKDANGAEGDTHFLNNANKAYLVVEGANAPMFSFGRGQGTTGIEDVELTIDNVVIYDITGRRVEKMEKGIYIVNGKKVLVK